MEVVAIAAFVGLFFAFVVLPTRLMERRRGTEREETPKG